MSVTAQWQPSAKRMDVSGEALHACAAVLAQVSPASCDPEKDVVFQINRAIVDIRVDESSIFTKDGTRLYARAVLRDWSGSAEASFTEQAIPALFGLEN